jgi:hypothetical protein
VGEETYIQVVKTSRDEERPKDLLLTFCYNPDDPNEYYIQEEDSHAQYIAMTASASILVGLGIAVLLKSIIGI